LDVLYGSVSNEYGSETLMNISYFFVRDDLLLVYFCTEWLLFCVRYNGLVNAKAVGISAGPDNKGFVLTTKRSKVNKNLYGSVADPDPGSGAFLTPGSGIRNRFFSAPSAAR
jgi:hypothetical protein